MGCTLPMFNERPPWLHQHMPYDPRPVRMPGMAPCAMDDWLRVDEAFAPQLALRDELVANQPGDVIAENGCAAAAELLDVVLAQLASAKGYVVENDHLCRPDGIKIAIDRACPMATLARCCQEDFCLLAPSPHGHTLTAAALCFPAHWTLAEKLNQPLVAIHTPVVSYDDGLARRVQRLFDAVRVDQPLWRHNGLRYEDPTLFQPSGVDNPRRKRPERQLYLRSERQSLLRLPVTGAVVFAIHTYLLHRDDVDPAWWHGIPA